MLKVCFLRFVREGTPERHCLCLRINTTFSGVVDYMHVKHSESLYLLHFHFHASAAPPVFKETQRVRTRICRAPFVLSLNSLYHAEPFFGLFCSLMFKAIHTHAHRHEEEKGGREVPRL